MHDDEHHQSACGEQHDERRAKPILHPPMRLPQRHERPPIPLLTSPFASAIRLANASTSARAAWR